MYFRTKIYQNEYRMDNNGKAGSDIKATRSVLQYYNLVCGRSFSFLHDPPLSDIL